MLTGAKIKARSNVVAIAIQTCQSLTVVLHDHGKAFDPGLIPEPNIDSSLEDRRERGLGLFFMRKLMDEVQFEFSREHGNTLTLVKRKKERG